MARHNIQFKGIRHTPSDITGQDGDLLECVNLYNENGEMKPIEMPEVTGVSGYYNDETLVAVHNTTDGKMFVFSRLSGTVTYIDIMKEQPSTHVFGTSITGEVMQWVETIGNTIAFGTDKSTYYVLYKDGAYKWLGDKLPQPIFHFDFIRETKEETGIYMRNDASQPYTYTPNNTAVEGVQLGALIPQGYEYDAAELSTDTYENKIAFRNAVRSKVSYVEHRARTENYFIYPFFVRYAVRLYDNSYAMHSAPLLMIPSSLKCPFLYYIKIQEKEGDPTNFEVHQDGGGNDYITATDCIDFRAMQLIYQFMGFAAGDGGSGTVTVSDWEDIIKSVDIFISSPIRSYDDLKWDAMDAIPTSFHCFKKTKWSGTSYVADDSVKDYGCCYSQNAKMSWFDIYENNDTSPFDEYEQLIYEDGTSNAYYKYYKVALPEVGENVMVEKIKNTSLFFNVKRYDINELSAAWNDPVNFASEAEEGILDRLETLPMLPDDYISRLKIASNVSYNYNQRLILGNIKLEAPLWYRDEKTFPDDSGKYDAQLWFKITKQSNTIWIKWEGESLGQKDFGHYIYYPDADCVEAVLVISGETWKSIRMTSHTGLNGAYALMPELESLYDQRTSFPPPSISADPFPSDRHFPIPNTIVMSSVANPFIFPVSNFKEIGRMDVLGIAANVLDVSYEQWGPFPLYGFCSDGIVSITIDKEGNFAGPVEAVSADILIKPHGLSQPTLIQASKALVFLTQRGVMMLSEGSKPQCVSLMMNGRNFNPLSDLRPTSPSPSVLYDEGAFASLISKTSGSLDFKTFVTGAPGTTPIPNGFLAYDYKHNRVLLLNPSAEYQYVLSLGTMLWSKQVPYTNGADIQAQTRPIPRYAVAVGKIQSAVNNYTELYLQDDSTTKKVYRTMDVADENSGTSLYQYGCFISRPVRFGTDEYKTITRLLNRHTHYTSYSFLKVAVYGSRDGVNYGRVQTLRGMGYQYFIFVVYTYLKPNERYSYMSVDFEPRMTNKLR